MPPMLMKTSVITLVARAVRAGIPNYIITGTVISAVLSVTSVIIQVAKTLAESAISCRVG
ncbi:MAG: hypothetical protein ABJC09_06455 [Terriglobia bacterium]